MGRNRNLSCLGLSASGHLQFRLPPSTSKSTQMQRKMVDFAMALGLPGRRRPASFHGSAHGVFGCESEMALDDFDRREVAELSQLSQVLSNHGKHLTHRGRFHQISNKTVG